MYSQKIYGAWPNRFRVISEDELVQLRTFFAQKDVHVKGIDQVKHAVIQVILAILQVWPGSRPRKSKGKETGYEFQMFEGQPQYLVLRKDEMWTNHACIMFTDNRVQYVFKNRRIFESFMYDAYHCWPGIERSIKAFSGGEQIELPLEV